MANRINLAPIWVSGTMGAALKLRIGGPALLYVVLFSALSAGCRSSPVMPGSSPSGNRALGVVQLRDLRVRCEVVWATVWPPLSFKAEHLMAIAAVLSTTISPYLFFWQAGQEVEDTREDADARPPSQASGQFVCNPH